MQVHFSVVFCILFLCESVYRAETKSIPSKITIKVINLDKNKQKWSKMQEIWSPHFKLERVSAKMHVRDPVCGLALSHISLLRQFEADPTNDFLLIMEDDAYPTSDFNATFVHKVMERAMKIPFWQVINLGPWFSRQPVVTPIDDYLVAIDYFHTTHFMGYHRRAVAKYLDAYANVIEKDYCLAVDNYFGNYGTAKSQALILASSRLMAYQNHGGKSDIGGGPEMNTCAVNAALAGRQVNVHINSAPSLDIAPTFEPPVYGYRVTSGGVHTGRVVWSNQCNLESDEVDERNVVEADGALEGGGRAADKVTTALSGTKKKKSKKKKKIKQRSVDEL
jgi:hypothetical protein